MTRDEIIEAAWKSGVWIPAGQGHAREQEIDRLERFVAIVAAAERAACATLVEKNADMCGPNTMLCDVLRGNAAAIRARGESDAR
ncbi:hypothetical protein [Thauera humireducens]|uniref:hypothetical protein n=1 Tax=Thauera humireducens TaxID=1134435 RepID=UPI00311E7FCE